MCGRFGLGNPERLDLLMRRLSFPAILSASPRFNVTPSQDIPIVVSLDGAPATWIAKWGLVPGWAKDPAVGNKLSMARGESAREKPSFREAIKRRRALMPADLFYEWQPNPTGKGAHPFAVKKRDEAAFFMGAMWEQWTSPTDANAAPLLTCCVITTDANEWLQPIQDRMPLLIDEQDIDRWLNPATPIDDIQSFMHPRAHDDLMYYRVSHYVNNPSHNDAMCAQPMTDEEIAMEGDPPPRGKAKAPAKEKRTDQLDAFL